MYLGCLGSRGYDGERSGEPRDTASTLERSIVPFLSDTRNVPVVTSRERNANLDTVSRDDRRLSWREQRALCNERHSEAIQHLRTLDHRESVSHLKSKASQGLHSHARANVQRHGSRFAIRREVFETGFETGVRGE